MGLLIAMEYKIETHFFCFVLLFVVVIVVAAAAIKKNIK